MFILDCGGAYLRGTGRKSQGVFYTLYWKDREKMGKYICYCFQHTEDAIEEDIREHGTSLVMEKIISEKKAGGCQCKTKNPKGR